MTTAPTPMWTPQWLRSMPSGYVHWVQTEPFVGVDGLVYAGTACRDDFDPLYQAAWGFTIDYPVGATRCPACLKMTEPAA